MENVFEETLERRGALFAAHIVALAAAGGQQEFAEEILRRRFGKSSRVALVAKGASEFADLSEHDRNLLFSKGAVTPATGLGGNWSAALYSYAAAIGEYIEVQKYYEIPGNMPLIRRVAFNQPLFTSTTGVAAGWTKSGAPVPISAGVLTRTTLKPLKISTAVVVTEETLSFGDPAALNTFITDMAVAVANEINLAFVDSANDGVSETKPPSITYGLTPITATASPRADLKAVLTVQPNAYATVAIAHPSLAVGLSGADFPNAGARGGEVSGIPLLCSGAVALDELIFADASGICLARGGVEVTVSREGSAVMADNPSGAAANLSFFQNNAAGIRVDSFINWTAVRDGCVTVLGDCEYGDEEGSA